MSALEMATIVTSVDMAFAAYRAEWDKIPDGTHAYHRAERAAIAAIAAEQAKVKLLSDALAEAMVICAKWSPGGLANLLPTLTKATGK